MSQQPARAVQNYLSSQQTQADLLALERTLDEAGTFRFEPLPNGIFPAALALQEDYEYTGYSNAWVRDNVLVAYGHYVTGQMEPASKCLSALADFFVKYQHRFTDIVSGQANADDPMQRPHIRFNAEKLEEIEQKWAHAQNDALGYFLWLYSKLCRAGHLQPKDSHRPLLGLFVDYFHTIRFWEDEDSGHWEEVRKISASSIGTATAGLMELSHLWDEKPDMIGESRDTCGRFDWLEDAITRGQNAMLAILPEECIQQDPLKHRKYDAALLFLIEPLQIVSGALADRIINNVIDHLQGEYGIRRYLGDSYWCADYKTKLDPEKRTDDFSDDQSARDALLSPGEEAQWCIFDPIISIIFGKRYQQSGNEADRNKQVKYFHRSLSQLTNEDSTFGPLKCSESYYLENGKYVPNDITPLLWTQSNLMQAMHVMKQTS